MVVWDPVALGSHPGGRHRMNPVRREFDVAAGRGPWASPAVGVTDGFQVSTPDPADAATSGLVHTLGYIDAVGRASRTDSRSRSGTGVAPPTRR